MRNLVKRALYSFPGSHAVLSKVSQTIGGIYAKDKLTEQPLVEKYFPSMVVSSGPFVGLTYPHFMDIGMPLKLAGAYEKYIYEWIDRALQAQYDTFINIGAGDGYYALGFALKSPSTNVLAFEIFPRYKEYFKEIKECNKIENATQKDLFKPQDLGTYKKGKTLILCDVEGAEKDLLDPHKSGELLTCDIIVECHDFADNSIVDTLLNRFYLTHNIEIINFQPMSSVIYDGERSRYGADFKAIINENRVVDNQKWLFMNVK